MERPQFNRQTYFDYLRVFAAFAVIMLHTAAKKWYSTDVNGFEWQVFNFFDSIVRWSVPVFTMISGALFLEKEVSLKKIYSKYVLRLTVSFITWSAVYAWIFSRDDSDRISKIALIRGHYHMWFIPMLIGLYICIPFIKAIVEDENRIKYYLALSFVFAFVFPQIVTLANDFAGERIIRGVSAINYIVNNMEINVVLGYTGYFILGYYLNKVDFNKKQRGIIYLLGAFGFAATIFLTLIVTMKMQTPCANYYDYFRVNILLESIAVFTWFKYGSYNHTRVYPFVMKLSKYSFGVYLIHVLILEQLNTQFGINTLSFNPILSVPCISFIVFLISFAISGILNQIPIVKKYMV